MGKKVSGEKGSRSLGRLGKAGNERVGLLIVFGLLLAFANTAYAGEWNKQDYSKTKIELHLNWGWTAPEQGRYWETWDDGYGKHMYEGHWT